MKYFTFNQGLLPQSFPKYNAYKFGLDEANFFLKVTHWCLGNGSKVVHKLGTNMQILN